MACVDGDNLSLEGLTAFDGGGLFRVIDDRNGAEGAAQQDKEGKNRKRAEFTDQNKLFHRRYSGYFVDYLHFMPGGRGYAF